MGKCGYCRIWKKGIWQRRQALPDLHEADLGGASAQGGIQPAHAGPRETGVPVTPGTVVPGIINRFELLQRIADASVLGARHRRHGLLGVDDHRAEALVGVEHALALAAHVLDIATDGCVHVGDSLRGRREGH